MRQEGEKNTIFATFDSKISELLDTFSPFSQILITTKRILCLRTLRYILFHFVVNGKHNPRFEILPKLFHNKNIYTNL
jgi:hypothetical protein